MRKILLILIPLFLIGLITKIQAEVCPYTCLDVGLCRGAGGTCRAEYPCGAGECCCETVPPPIPAEGFARLIGKIIDFVRDIAMAGAGIIIIIGGYLMVTSAGNPEKFESGKRTILYALIAIIIILIAEELAEKIISLVS